MIKSFADLLYPHDPDLLLSAAAAGKRLLLRTDRSTAFARLLPWERFNDAITPDRVLSGDIEFARNNVTLPAEMTIVRPRRQKPPTRMNIQALEQYAGKGVSIIINGFQRWETELEPGDVLCPPRGEVHAAQVHEGEDSLHLTIGITPPGIESLTAALAATCEEDALGREDIPILAAATDREDWLAAMNTLLHSAVDRLDMEQLLDSLDQAREPLPAGFLGLGRRLSPELLVVSTLRGRLPLPPVEAGATTTLSAGGRSWTIDATEWNILELVQKHHTQALASLRNTLTEFDDEQLSQAVLALSGKGLVRLLQDDERDTETRRSA